MTLDRRVVLAGLASVAASGCATLSRQRDPPVSGVCDSRLEPVRAAFEANFRERGEVGAAVAIALDGRMVCDLWGGFRDRERSAPWERDTIVCMQSVGKGILALVAHALADQGALDFEQPVARYWPEFAAADKGEISVASLVGHHAALIYPDLAPAGSMFDWRVMTNALAAQAPQWPADTRGAYHSSTYGHLVGELCRRAGADTVTNLLKALLTGPARADYRYGAPRRDRDRVATTLPNPAAPTLRQIFETPDSPLARAWRPLPPTDDLFNSDLFRSVVFPSANGHGNARGAARIFAAIGAKRNPLLSSEALQRLSTQRWHEVCGLTGRPFRMSDGCFMNEAVIHRMGPSARAFGAAGGGGHYAFFDPDRTLAFAYCMNYFNADSDQGARPLALVDALYQAIG